jgi:hypothetical protein
VKSGDRRHGGGGTGALPGRLWTASAGRRTIEHFSLANPKGQGQGNVPLLLRRVADVIENFRTTEIQDLILRTEVNEFGNWPSITVYFHRGQAVRGH